MNNQKRTCIIIEDNPAFVKVLQAFLKKIGNIEILECHDDSVGSAVSIFRHRPDLIFLDVGISGLNGLEMLETLEYRPKTIVISNHNADFLDLYQDVKVDAFLQKPVKFEDFKRVVDEVLPTSSVT
jgi:two-component system, LytTR family, response regulator